MLHVRRERVFAAARLLDWKSSGIDLQQLLQSHASLNQPNSGQAQAREHAAVRMRADFIAVLRCLFFATFPNFEVLLCEVSHLAPLLVTWYDNMSDL